MNNLPLPPKKTKPLSPEEASTLLNRWRKDPKTYIDEVLGIEAIWKLQADVLNVCPIAIKEHKPIYIASGQSLGKDYICSAISLWFLHCYCPSIVIQTAPTDRQVKKIMWGETLARWHNKKIDLGGQAYTNPYLEIVKDNWYLIGFTTKETGASKEGGGGKFQGFHKETGASKEGGGGKFQGFHCLSEDTEILTKRGFKTIDEIDLNDFVLSPKIGETKAEWRPIQAIHKYPYEGKLNVIDNKSISFAVTDEHRFPSKYGLTCKKWELKKFSELKKQFVIQKKISWTGRKFRVPKEFQELSVNEFAEFIGFWTGDGGTRQHHKTKRFYEVIFYQKKETNFDYLKGLLRHYKWSKGKDYFCISNRKMCEWLLNNIGRYGKDRIIPRFILDATPEIIERYLEGLWKAEGSYINDEKKQIYNTSKRLMDGVQELLLKLGKPAKLSINHQGNELHNTCYCISYTSLKDNTTIKKKEVKKIDYFGRVWCISTENQTFIARRNGKCFVSGNSPNLCVIASEAQAIEDNIYDQIDAITTSENILTIYIGNPDNIVFNFSCLDNPNYKQRRTVIPGLASYEWVEDKRKRWGEDDPRWIGRVLGQIPEQAINKVFSEWLIRHMCARKDLLAFSGLNAGVAVDAAAEGIDDNVFISGKNGDILNVYTKTLMSPTEIAHQAVKMCKEIDGNFIILDCDGVGIGPYQELKKMDDSFLQGIKIVKFHGSAKSEVTEKDRIIYENMRAEAAFVTQARAKAGKASLDINDAELLEDLGEEEYFTNKRGLLQIEPKEDIKERLKRSPGKGDAYKMLQWAFEKNFKKRIYFANTFPRRKQEQAITEYAILDY